MLQALLVIACLAVAVGLNPLGWAFSALRSRLLWEVLGVFAVLGVAVLALLYHL